MTAPGLSSCAYAVPSMRAEPADGGTRPVIIRIVVVLPAPFGPRKPVTVPGSRAKDTSSTTVRLPYCLVSPLTLIISGSSGGRPWVEDESAEKGALPASAGGLEGGSTNDATSSSES